MTPTDLSQLRDQVNRAVAGLHAAGGRAAAELRPVFDQLNRLAGVVRPAAAEAPTAFDTWLAAYEWPGASDDEATMLAVRAAWAAGVAAERARAAAGDAR